MKPFLRGFLSFLLLMALFQFAGAQTSDQEAVITVQRDSLKPVDLNRSDLAKFRRIDVRARDRDGKDYTFSGVALSDILKKAGVIFGAQHRGPNMSQYLVAKSGDGYQVLFALPELDSSFSDRTIILADQMDGKPLPSVQGPLRIIVPGEKKPARWIWAVRTLTVRFVKG